MEDGKPGMTLETPSCSIGIDMALALGSLYVYTPNKGAPVVFTVAFAASAVCHIWQG